MVMHKKDSSMKLRINLIIFSVIVITLILTFIPIIYYAYNFHSISSNTNDWANLGSYIGGILIPLYSLLSLIFIVWISILIYRRDTKYNKKQLEIPKTKALNELRMQRLYDLRKELYSNDTIESYYSFKNLTLLDMIIANFLLSSTHLFNSDLLTSKSIKFQMYARILDIYSAWHGMIGNYTELKAKMKESEYSDNIDFDEIDLIFNNIKNKKIVALITEIFIKYNLEKNLFLAALEMYTIEKYERIYL